MNDPEIQNKTSQAIAALLQKHQASRATDEQSTRSAALCVGVLPDENSGTSAFQLKPSSALNVSEWSSPVGGDYDIVIDLTDDTNNKKLPALKQAANAPGDTVYLVHSETKSASALLANTPACLNATAGTWAGYQLLELVTSPTTPAQAREQAAEFSSHAFDATLVTHGDARGLIWRVRCSYLVEAMALLGEAADPNIIEEHAMKAQMRCAPLLELDQISLKLMDHVLHDELHRLSHAGHNHGHEHEHKHDHGHKHEHDHDHGHDHGHSHDVPSELMPESAVYVLEKMAHGFDRLGARFGAGFYDYDYDDDPPELWDGLSAFARGANRVDPNDIRDRLLFAPVIETLRCMQDGLIANPDSANLGATLGAGFSASLGGPFGMIQSIGAEQFSVRAGELAGLYGKRFVLPAQWDTTMQSGA